MNITDVLGQELGYLAEVLKAVEVPLIVGGGYGLLLRQKHIESSKIRTVRPFPRTRSTQDLDLFLSIEFITSPEKMTALKEALLERGYQSIPGAYHYQFSREVDVFETKRTVKIDLLAPPPRDAELLKQMKVDSRRLRPKAVTEIHAHVCEEAFSVAEKALYVEVKGDSTVSVMLPHPFSFFLLKLFAYRDQVHNQEKEYGRYHAFDIYRVAAMTSETEYAEVMSLARKYADDELVKEAGRIVSTLFDSTQSTGVLAIREYAIVEEFDLEPVQIDEFVIDLKTFFGPEPRGTSRQFK